MKRIMFNDALGLTDSVIKGLKTREMWVMPVQPSFTDSKLGSKEETDKYLVSTKPLYTIGEIVSVAQSYDQIKEEMKQDPSNPIYQKYIKYAYEKDLPGNTNKMFVRSDFMPHNIRIISQDIMQLQNITERECLELGIQKFIRNGSEYRFSTHECTWEEMEETLIAAFRKLIHTTYGKNIWEKNPWICSYTFKLIN